MTDETTTTPHRRRKPRGTEPRPARKRYANRGGIRGRVRNPGLATDADLESVEPPAEPTEPQAPVEPPADDHEPDANPEGV